MTKVRLIVVDDHSLFRAGLISLLAQMPELEVIGDAGDGQEALTLIQRMRPDVVLLDVNMPLMGGVETVRALHTDEAFTKNPPRVIMLTISKHEEDLFGAIQAGADGYLLKNAEPDELRKAILSVAAGQGVLSPEVTSRVMRAVSRGQAVLPDAGLSKRELDVLECLAKGLTSTQIAAHLFVSENTVKTHVRHILEKLEASNRAEAVSKAVKLGVIRSVD